MNFIKISFLIFVISINISSLFAGQNVWTNLAGSPSNLKSMARASDGTLYVGTETGVSRGVVTSDGVSWSTYNGSDSDIGSRSVTALVVSESNLYAGTGGGVYRGMIASNGTVTWSSYNGLGSNIGTRSVITLVMSGSHLYAGTDRGVYRGILVSDGSVSWSSYNGTDSDIGSRSIAALLVSGGVMYAGSNAGIYRGVIGSDSSLTWLAYNGSGSDIGTRSVTALVMSGSNLYAGTDRGVYRGNIGSNANINWELQSLGDPVIHNVTTLILSSSENDLYAGSQNGIFRGQIRGSTSPLIWTYFTGGIPESSRVTAMLEGGSNHFYAAVSRNGVYNIEMLCGNSNRDPHEQCDDGNVTALDGCSHVCQDEVFSFTSSDILSEIVRGESGSIYFNFFNNGFPYDQEVIFTTLGSIPDGITINEGRPFSYFINLDSPVPIQISALVPLGEKTVRFSATAGLRTFENDISFLVTDGAGGGSGGTGGTRPNPDAGTGADSGGGCSCHVAAQKKE